MEQERHRPPQGGGGSGGGGRESPASGEGGIMVLLLVVLLVIYLFGDGGDYVNPLAPSSELSFAIVLVTTVLAFGVNGRIKYTDLVVQADKVLVISFIFSVFLRYSGVLPDWVSSNFVMLMGIFQIAAVAFRVKLKAMKVDMPEIVFGTAGFLIVLFVALNVSFVGQFVNWFQGFVSGVM